MVVHGRVSAAPGRPRECQGPRPQALSSHQQLGAGGEERPLAAPGAEDEALRERLAQDAEDRRGIVCRGREHVDLPSQDDLVERAGADALDGARDRLLVVLGRHRAGDVEAPGGVRVQQRQRRLAQSGGAGLEPREHPLGVVVGREERGERQAHLLPTPGERDLGHVQRRRRKPPPVRRGAALGCEGEASDGDRAGRAEAVGRVALGRPGEGAPRPRHRGEALRPARVERLHAPERAQGGAVAVGLLYAEPRLFVDARRDRDRDRIHIATQLDRDRRQHLARRRAPRTPDRRLEAPEQPRAVRRGQPEAPCAEAGGGHRPEILRRGYRANERSRGHET